METEEDDESEDGGRDGECFADEAGKEANTGEVAAGEVESR